MPPEGTYIDLCVLVLRPCLFTKLVDLYLFGGKLPIPRPHWMKPWFHTAVSSGGGVMAFPY